MSAAWPVLCKEDGPLRAFICLRSSFAALGIVPLTLCVVARGAASIRGAPPQEVTPSGVGVTYVGPAGPLVREGSGWLSLSQWPQCLPPWADGQRAAFTHSEHSCFLDLAGRLFWGSRPCCSSQPPCSGLSALLTAVTKPSAAPNWLCALEPTAQPLWSECPPGEKGADTHSCQGTVR